MTTRPVLAAVVAVTLSALVAMTGCGTTIAGTATAASTPPVATSSDTAEAAATEAVDEHSGAAAVESQTPDPVPPVSPPADSGDPQPSGAPNGPAARVDANSVAWLQAFCTGFTDVMQYADLQVDGMSGDAVLQTIVDSYTAMSEAAGEAAAYLDSIPQPTFPGAETVSLAITDWLQSVAAAYGFGASVIANGEFNSDAELSDKIRSIEDAMAGPNDRLGYEIARINPAAQETVAGLHECQPLADSG